MEAIQVLGIAGSLRAASFNRRLLQAAVDLAPQRVSISIFDRLGEIPPYNADVDSGGEPEPVGTLRRAIRSADALLIATPEYNYNIPGVLKNALDWASRPAQDSSLKDKAVLLMGAATGMVGTARAQMALRQLFVFTQSWVLTGPEILVSKAAEKFDAEGRLTDEKTREFVTKGLERLQAFVLMRKK